MWSVQERLICLLISQIGLSHTSDHTSLAPGQSRWFHGHSCLSYPGEVQDWPRAREANLCERVRSVQERLWSHVISHLSRLSNPGSVIGVAREAMCERGESGRESSKTGLEQERLIYAREAVKSCWFHGLSCLSRPGEVWDWPGVREAMCERGWSVWERPCAPWTLSHTASLTHGLSHNTGSWLAETDHMSKWERPCARESDFWTLLQNQPLSHLRLSDRSVLSNQELLASLTDLSYPIRNQCERGRCTREADFARESKFLTFDSNSTSDLKC